MGAKAPSTVVAGAVVGAIVALGACGLARGQLIPVFAGGGNGAPSGRTTAWTVPKAGIGPGECVWDAVTTPPRRDERKDDPPNRGISIYATNDAYAHSISQGMQIWGYSWAAFGGFRGNSAAAASSASGGVAKVERIRSCDNGVPSVQLDWDPRFRARVHLLSNTSWTEAGGVMAGDCRELGVSILASAALRRETDPRGDTVIKIGDVQVTLESYLGPGAEEVTAIARAHVRASITSATASWHGASHVASTAIGRWRLGLYPSEAESYVWDSSVDLDLYGHCEMCGGSATVLYDYRNDGD